MQPVRNLDYAKRTLDQLPKQQQQQSQLVGARKTTFIFVGPVDPEIRDFERL